jgi:hypothetical protein
MISIRTPKAALMVEAWDSEHKYLGRLESNDKATWVLDLGDQWGKEFTLQFIVVAGKSFSWLDRVAVDGEMVTCGGGAVREPGTDKLTETHKTENSLGSHGKEHTESECVEVGMAVYGMNIAFEDDVGTPIECWRYCQTMPDCKFWNHNMYSAEVRRKKGKVGRCHVKSGKGKHPGSVAGYTFGPRDCRPAAGHTQPVVD